MRIREKGKREVDNRLKEIFKIMSFYDEYRWEYSHNYNLINFFRADLTADTKILTHWLCYITDRQMPFQRIWDIGGYVFSELIYELKNQKSLNLLSPEHENSFVKESEDGKFTFISKSTANNNSIIANYEGIFENGKVKFKSRFFPSDYMAILYTFVFLQDYDFSFSKFIKEAYCRHKEEHDFVKKILFSLSLLSYDGIGQPNSNNLNYFADNIQKANDRKNRIKGILSNDSKFNKEYNKFLKSRVFKQKRAWCSLRDFLKSPEFMQYFEDALREEGLGDDDFRRLFSYDALTQLELPGDVWNNNSKFGKCILKNTDYGQSAMGLNKILRDFYNNNQHIVGYPEQFDITFDFVPRMCDLDNCDLCPIYRIDNKDNNFNKICLKNEKMYCPVALVSCNYKNNCRGIDKCKIV